MQQQPIRRNVPVKGMNTVSPRRAFSEEFAPSIINCWYDDGVSLKRRLCQAASTVAAQLNPIKSMVEYKVSTQEFLIQDSVTGAISKFTAAATVATPTLAAFGVPIGGIAVKKVRAATLNGLMIMGDGQNPAQVYDGAAFVAPTALPTPSAVGKPIYGDATIGSIFHIHQGRCYAAGNPAYPMNFLYSDAMNSSGVKYWSAVVSATGEQGGFVNIGADLDTGDVITGLATHRGFLVVFCKNNILFYTTVVTAAGVGHALYKRVAGEGCVSPDSIQAVGEDVIFLSPNGFKKLSVSLIQGDSQVNDLSQPVNNIVKQKLHLMTPAQIENVSSTYNATYGLYMLSFGDGDVWVMQPAFDGWFLWKGLAGHLFTASTQETYHLTTAINTLTNTVFADAGITPLPVAMSWEVAPFKVGVDRQIRWNKLAVIYESTAPLAPAAHTLSVTSYPDLIANRALTSPIPTTPNSPIEQGGTMLEGLVVIPLAARGELMTVILSNSDNVDFRFKLVEAYFNVGGIRE